MRIVNKSGYRADDLRRFFRAGLLFYGASLDKKIVVHEIGGELRRHKTHASYPRGSNGGRMLVLDGDVPREGGLISMGLSRDNPLVGAYGTSTAAIFHHEVMHTLGLRHKDMDEATLWSKAPQPWAEGLQIRRKPEKVKAPLVEQRAAKAARMLAKWQRIERRAKSAVKRWSAKVRYYERRKNEPRIEPDQVAAVAGEPRQE